MLSDCEKIHDINKCDCCWSEWYKILKQEKNRRNNDNIKWNEADEVITGRCFC